MQQLGGEFERQRVIRRRQLKRSASAAILAFALFVMLGDLSTWPGRAALVLAIVASIAAARAIARFRRT